MRSQDQMVNEVNIEGVARLFVMRGQGISAIVVGLQLGCPSLLAVSVSPPRQQVASGVPLQPDQQSNLFGRRVRSEAHCLTNPAFIHVALYR